MNLRWRDGGFAGRDARKATTRMVRPRRAEQCLPKGRCDPAAGCLRPNKTVVRSKHPLRCPIPALRGPSGDAPGRSFARSLTRQTTRKAPPHKGCSKIRRDRAGRSSFFQRKMRPRSGLLASHVYFGALRHPRRCPIPASRGPSGHALGSHGVALLGIVVPATTFVVRLMIIPILPATRSTRICSALP